MPIEVYPRIYAIPSYLGPEPAQLLAWHVRQHLTATLKEAVEKLPPGLSADSNGTQPTNQASIADAMGDVQNPLRGVTEAGVL